MQLKKQILVVEDNALNREMLQVILSEQYSVLEAENGQEALCLLRQRGSEDVALILLDIMMPVMNGLTFLDRIKEDEKLSLIPVIVMTQNEGEVDEVTALAHGATDFVPKPYRPQVILHRVASIINLRETAAMVNLFRYDKLTGLYSKEFFFQQVRRRLQENPDKEYCIVCSNIENFKLYNDAFGAAAGDRMLKAIADIMREAIGVSGICGRFAADRFLCLQEIERERKDRKYYESSKLDLSSVIKNLVMRWGIYEIVDRSVSVEQMCDRAQLAADSIRGQYNRSFAVYDDALRGKLLREQAITEAMETALRERQFKVYLQPKYCLHDDELAGAEALVRWIHPEWGFMSPGEFIPLFEKNGFITQLDRYIWEEVCKLLRDWREKGYAPLPVSVNVSRADVYQADLVETLQAIVGRYGVEPSQLHLELTESAYTENPAQILDAVAKLRQQGFIIEMDDFGSGYSSLNMLNQMKLDILKLDMKFIQNETAKPAEQGILRFIVSLARWLNLSVVAEGVETREQLERLREIGCDYVQGYFFARPMPGAEFEALLSKQSAKKTLPAGQGRRYDSSVQRILLVDEDAAYRASVIEGFSGLYQIQEATCMREGLDLLAGSEEAPIDAVILSASLPDNGAGAFLEEMRRDPAHWRIPVLATIQPGESIEAPRMDIDDFLCKRHPIFDLRKRMRRLLNEVRYREREQMLLNEAYRDYLTGLLNRRGLYAAIDALRQEDLPLAMYMFDLDNLKKVNDNLGHDKGDDMLRAFAELLHQQTREGDILCRYGGDEFVVILRRIANRETILRKGGEICGSFGKFLTLDGIPASCSGGVAMCGENEKPSCKLIERADQALYRAKHERKGNCILWEE